MCGHNSGVFGNENVQVALKMLMKKIEPGLWGLSHVARSCQGHYCSPLAERMYTLSTFSNEQAALVPSETRVNWT